MEFDWMTPKTSPHAASYSAKRVIMYRQEVAQRAGIFFRLGYPAAKACARLCQNADWDFAMGTGGVPEGLSAQDIADIVEATYARRPAS